MSISYHELTHGLPKNPKAERQQTLLIFFLTMAYMFYTTVSAGLLAPLSFTTTTFSGGEFVYKLMTNDYVAVSGAVSTIARDLGFDVMDQQGYETPRDTTDLIYTVFFDDSSKLPGGTTRFASGALIKGDKNAKSRLLEMNKSIPEVNEGKLSKDTRYEVGNLPKVEAISLDHPFTGGAWSSLFMRYKILPAFKKHAKEQTTAGNHFILISTCSEKQGMCTFYMPLSKQDKFFMGETEPDEYATQFLSHAGFLERMGADIEMSKFFGVDWIKIARGLKRAAGFSGKDEL